MTRTPLSPCARSRTKPRPPARRERMIESHQTQIEVDEPEDDSMALLMGSEMDRPAQDDMSEEKLLRALMQAQGED